LDHPEEQRLIARHLRNFQFPLDTHGKIGKAIVEKHVESVGRAAKIGTATPKNKKIADNSGFRN
jgi:hypothetical protein